MLSVLYQWTKACKKDKRKSRWRQKNYTYLKAHLSQLFGYWTFESNIFYFIYQHFQHVFPLTHLIVLKKQVFFVECLENRLKTQSFKSERQVQQKIVSIKHHNDFQKTAFYRTQTLSKKELEQNTEKSEQNREKIFGLSSKLFF